MTVLALTFIVYVCINGLIGGVRKTFWSCLGLLASLVIVFIDYKLFKLPTYKDALNISKVMNILALIIVVGICLINLDDKLKEYDDKTTK